MGRVRWNEAWFTPGGRRGGASFAAAVVALNLAVVLAVPVAGALLGFGFRKIGIDDVQREIFDDMGAVFTGVVAAAYLWASLALIAQRFRDFGQSGWLALFWVVVLGSTPWMPAWAQTAGPAAWLLLLALVPGAVRADAGR